MRLAGQDVLRKAIRKHADARQWLEAWAETAENANWLSLEDVKEDYQATDGVKLKNQIVITVFNVKGNEYRLLTHVNYRAQSVLILELLTHSEYSKDLWKKRY